MSFYLSHSAFNCISFSQGPAGMIFHHLVCHLYLVISLGTLLLKHILGFPGGAVVEGLPAGAGDAGSGPGLGGSRVPRSGWAREPRLLSLRVWSLCPAAGGAAIVGGPRAAMKSGSRTAMKGGPRLP